LLAPRRSILTLIFCTLLHAFTHAFGSLLVPLYLLMVADLHLHGVRQAALIVTLYGLVYNICSYPAGVLADHFNRKWLLAIGLLGNSLAMGSIGLSRHYPEMVLLGVVAGLFASLFHPCANSLVPAHFPENPGLAIGLLGIGSGIGFFVGPQFSGWRAQEAHWHFAQVAAWQKPCVELGAAGVICAILFLIFARETRTRADLQRMKHLNSASADSSPVAILPAQMSTEEIVMRYEAHPPGIHLSRSLFWRVVGIGSTLGMRDFAGVGTITLSSIYLQKAFAYSPKHAGLAVGLMMLLSVLVNPASVYLSSGKRRLPLLATALMAGGVAITLVPCFGAIGAVITFCVFQTFQLGSYAMSDAAILERVPPAVRGRVVGVFLTIAGTFGACAPFVMGWWTDLLGNRAAQPHAYVPIFLALGSMMALASLATKLIARLA
jgi:MFS family permease